jgi:glycosyltransferase involved in cell wall biosynthesis
MPPTSPDIGFIDRVAIVLPARNERETIGDALLAIGRAIDHVGTAAACSIAVVDDGSSDGTGSMAPRALAALAVPARVIRVDVGCVGAARRIGIDEMTSAWRAPERAWVLSTDADSRVRHDWIARHLDHARRGAPAVSGIVDLIDSADVTQFRPRWQADYGATIAPDHRHPYAHATNLGVRLDAYREVGGFHDLTGAEDADLWRRLRAAGLAPVADAQIVVDTSGRRRGRVAAGFAHALATLYPVPEALPG